MDGIAAFEAHLENRAWQAVERTKDKCDAETYRERIDAVSRLIAAQAFSYGGDIAAKAAVTAPGIKFVMLWMLQSAPQNANLDVDERLVENIFTDMFDEAQARMHEANADPNRQPPVSRGEQYASQGLPPSSEENPGATSPGKSAS